MLPAVALPMPARLSELRTTTAHPDAELLRLAARFAAVDAQLAALWRAQDMRERDGDWSDDPAIDALVAETRALRGEIGEARPVTTAGIAAKLRAALLDWDRGAPPKVTDQHYLGWCLCCNLAAQAGA
jgi:hypothetical protein